MKNIPPIVWLMLGPPWAVFLLFCYWWFFDTSAPTVINYQHPYFLSEPVSDRDEAKAKQITEIEGGSTVWTYNEFCVYKKVSGVFRSRWQMGAFIWPVDQRPFIAYPLGCHAVSFPVEVPTSNPTRYVKWYSMRDFEVNPLRTVTVEREPIPLAILAPRKP